MLQSPTQHASLAFTVSQTGSTVVALSPLSFGLKFFPDGSMFVTNIGGTTYFFAPSGGQSTSRTQGTIVLTGTVHHLVPLMHDDRGNAVPSPLSGSTPGLGDADFAHGFDRDYAAGGPVLADANSGTLLHMYHSEYHFFQGRPFEFYSALGLAISNDRGRSFWKLGLAIRPAIPPEARVRMPTSAGSLVERTPYIYAYYSDLSADQTCDGRSAGHLPCVAVARTTIADVRKSASSRAPPPWFKYYHGGFTEPGIGGAFSPLFVTPPAVWARWPMVTFDPASNRYLMVYAAGESGLELRDSTDGLSWSDPTNVLLARNDEEINYPSILELTDAGGAGPFRIALTIGYVTMPRNGRDIDFASRSFMTLPLTITEP